MLTVLLTLALSVLVVLQIYTLFGKVGAVRRVLMGLDRNTKTPCGFCFVIYHTRKDALAAVKYLNGTKLDNRQLRVDIDYGFEEGRQFGRGRSGGQVSSSTTQLLWHPGAQNEAGCGMLSPGLARMLHRFSSGFPASPRESFVGYEVVSTTPVCA